MELKVEGKLRQQLGLFPKQQIFLKLLSIPVLELRNFLEEEVEENPFLESEFVAGGEVRLFQKEQERLPSFKELLIHQLHIFLDSEILIKQRFSQTL